MADDPTQTAGAVGDFQTEDEAAQWYFENTHLQLGYDFRKSSDGKYLHVVTQRAWEDFLIGWSEARSGKGNE